MERSYDTMRRIYLEIFERCGLEVVLVEADSGAIGGAVSEEFMVRSELGEDTIIVTEDGRAANAERAADLAGERAQAIEVGHIFQLGVRYSEPMRASFADALQQQRSFWMGCYGIGVTRMVQALVEQHCDAAGMIWPRSIAPYHVHLIQTRRHDEVQTALCERIYAALQDRRIEVLWDERDLSTGAQLADADLIGLPFRLIARRDAEEGRVELSERAKPSGTRRLQVHEAIAELEQNLLRTQP